MVRRLINTEEENHEHSSTRTTTTRPAAWRRHHRCGASRRIEASHDRQRPDRLRRRRHAVFAVAGGLLTWGNSFASDYVGNELSSQNITFPSAEALTEEGRTDLVKFADQKLDTGEEAEAYASFINGHLEGIADGATYADLGAVESAAKADVKAAVEAGEPQAKVDELQATADGVSAQRNSLFKGETLRGLLLSAYAWSTVGMIAGIAAIAAFAAAAVMLVLVGLGVDPSPEDPQDRLTLRSAERTRPALYKRAGRFRVSGEPVRRDDFVLCGSRRIGGAQWIVSSELSTEEVTEMKALVYHGPGNKSWEEVPDAVILDGTDAIVRVEATTICGTDLHILKGDVPAVTDGRILGHEAVGTVIAVRRWRSTGEGRRSGARLVHHIVRHVRVLPHWARRPMPRWRRLDPRPQDRWHTG